MAVDLFADELDLIGNDPLFDAIKRFAELQPSEGWRHDFTEEWADSALKNVAAFANTFGGLLIVGVKKGKKDTACELLGVESEAEYKTRIASSIAANISPVPSYRVFECHFPGELTKKFCIVRIRETRALHLVTKKDMQPVYVRNEDETRIADAIQLRRLIDRERETPGHEAEVQNRVIDMRDNLLIGFGYQKVDSDTWFLGPRNPSQTFLKQEMILAERVPLELERSHEEWLLGRIGELYPRVRDTAAQEKANVAEDRGANFYQYTWYHKGLDYEGKWRITDMGDIGQATQMSTHSLSKRSSWSAVDLARYIILFIRLSLRWWQNIGYFGDGNLYIQLSLDNPSLEQDTGGHYIHLFDPTYTPGRRSSQVRFRSDTILQATSPRTSASVRTKIGFSPDNRTLTRITTSVLNQLLCSLGHAVIWSVLKENIQPLIED